MFPRSQLSQGMLHIYTLCILFQSMNSNFSKGVAFAKANNYSEALKAFTASIEQHPNKFTSYLNRGCIECCLGLDEFAIEDFNKVIELEPYEITGYYNRFISYYKTGHKLEAQKDLYIALSLAYTKKGEQTKTIKMMARALGLVENNALAHVKRGNLYKDQNNFAMAQNDYTGALQIDDKHLGALTARAGLYKSNQQADEAQEDVDKIAELSKTHAKNKIVLIPSVDKMDPEGIQSDIQAKVKEFTTLRNQIFKNGHQQPVNTESVQPPTSKKQQQIQVKPPVVEDSSHLDSQGNQSIQNKQDQVVQDQSEDFPEVSRSNNLGNNSTVSREAPQTTSDKKQSNLLQLSIEDDPTNKYQLKVTKTQDEPNQKQTHNQGEPKEQGQNEDDDQQNQRVEINETQVGVKPKQEFRQQTGDDVLEGESSEQYLDAQRHDEVSKANEENQKEPRLQKSDNMDNVKSSRDDQLVEVPQQVPTSQPQDGQQKQKGDQEPEEGQASHSRQLQTTKPVVGQQDEQSLAEEVAQQRKTKEQLQEIDSFARVNSEEIQQQSDQKSKGKALIDVQTKKPALQERSIQQPSEEEPQLQQKTPTEAQKTEGQDLPTTDADKDIIKRRFKQEQPELSKDSASLEKSKAEDVKTKPTVGSAGEQNNQQYKEQQELEKDYQSGPQHEPSPASPKAEPQEDVTPSAQDKSISPDNQKSKQKADEKEGRVADQDQSGQIEEVQSHTEGQENADQQGEDTSTKPHESQSVRQGDEFVDNPLSDKDEAESGTPNEASRPDKDPHRFESIKLVQSVDVVEHHPDATKDEDQEQNKLKIEKADAQVRQTLSEIQPSQRLSILIQSGTLTRNTEWIGKMSPYVMVEYNGWVMKTEVLENAGKAPVWEQTLLFNYTQSNDSVVFKVFDKETFKNDDLIGEATVSIKALLESGVVQLTFQDEQVGEVLVEATILK